MDTAGKAAIQNTNDLIRISNYATVLAKLLDPIGTSVDIELILF